MKTFKIELNKKKDNIRTVQASYYVVDDGVLIFKSDGRDVATFATGTWVMVNEYTPVNATSGTITISKGAPGITFNNTTGNLNTGGSVPTIPNYNHDFSMNLPEVGLSDDEKEKIKGVWIDSYKSQ